MTTKENGITLLCLIEQMRDCRKKQSAFRRQKNTENYKAMLACEEATDEMLKAVRRNVVSQMKELNIEVLPCLSANT
jgi:hypothetical protein